MPFTYDDKENPNNQSNLAWYGNLTQSMGAKQEKRRKEGGGGGMGVALGILGLVGGGVAAAKYFGRKGAQEAADVAKSSIHKDVTEYKPDLKYQEGKTELAKKLEDMRMSYKMDNIKDLDDMPQELKEDIVEHYRKLKADGTIQAHIVDGPDQLYDVMTNKMNIDETYAESFVKNFRGGSAKGFIRPDGSPLLAAFVDKDSIHRIMTMNHEIGHLVNNQYFKGNRYMQSTNEIHNTEGIINIEAGAWGTAKLISKSEEFDDRIAEFWTDTYRKGFGKESINPLSEEESQALLANGDRIAEKYQKWSPNS